MNFLGTYNHNLDDKNRLAIPKKIANKIVDKAVIVSKGFDGCLEIRLKDSFKRRLNEILSLSQNKKASRILSREILANSYEIDLDNAKRILIPNVLLNIAQIKKEVTIIGIGDKLEIWDPTIYHNFITKADKEFEEIAETINDENRK